VTVNTKERPAEKRREASVAEIMPVPRIIRDPEFASRLTSACDNHPDAPDKHDGRLRWLKDELAKRGQLISPETARKWFAGESRPRPAKMGILAQTLEVDPAWLSMGIDPDLGPRERKVRNAMVDGAVNLVAGFIQMDGGHPAFPDDDDKRAKADNVDLYAVIKGASYAFNVCLGTREEELLRFVVPSNYENVIVIGVLRDGFNVKLFEIPSELIADKGHRRGGSVELLVSRDEEQMRWIESFTERL